MAYTTIDNPGLFFNTVLYTGNGTTDHAITGVGFQPDWTWLKKRNNADDNILSDVVRGATKYLISNSSTAEATYAEGFKSFDSDGFTLGNANNTNQNTHTFAAWNWRAGNSSGSSNGDGNVATTVSANTTAGFSIVSYTGDGGATATFGHGLGAIPKMIFLKKRSGSTDWVVYHEAITYANRLKLNTTDASASSPNWRATPTSSVFNSNSSDIINNSGDTYIAYCFAEKKGYSKFGSYIGNGNADGPFVYTGFRPAWIMTKNASSSATSWIISDNKRNTSNVMNTILRPDNSGAEQTFDYIDHLSNGFKLRYSSDSNTNGNTIIYMAFAEHPFVTEGTKAAGTAR
jgi:hypothetical protein